MQTLEETYFGCRPSHDYDVDANVHFGLPRYGNEDLGGAGRSVLGMN